MGRTFDSKNVASSERSAMVSPDATLTPQQAAIQSQPRTHVIRDVGTLESAMQVFYPSNPRCGTTAQLRENQVGGHEKTCKKGQTLPWLAL